MVESERTQISPMLPGATSLPDSSTRRRPTPCSSRPQGMMLTPALSETPALSRTSSRWSSGMRQVTNPPVSLEPKVW
jgi:hypothetical protein